MVDTSTSVIARFRMKMLKLILKSLRSKTKARMTSMLPRKVVMATSQSRMTSVHLAGVSPAPASGLPSARWWRWSARPPWRAGLGQAGGDVDGGVVYQRNVAL